MLARGKARQCSPRISHAPRQPDRQNKEGAAVVPEGDEHGVVGLSVRSAGCGGTVRPCPGFVPPRRSPLDQSEATREKAGDPRSLAGLPPSPFPKFVGGFRFSSGVEILTRA